MEAGKERLQHDAIRDVTRAEVDELKESTIYKSRELKKFFELCVAIDGFPKHL